jgi:hypothetical protein
MFIWIKSDLFFYLQILHPLGFSMLASQMQNFVVKKVTLYPNKTIYYCRRSDYIIKTFQFLP